jgi:hypothetical protein
MNTAVAANDEVDNSETAHGEGQDEKDGAFQSHDVMPISSIRRTWPREP